MSAIKFSSGTSGIVTRASLFPADEPARSLDDRGAEQRNEMTSERRKQLGAYYTPPEVAKTLVRWVVRREADNLLDPSCGDGRFLAEHCNSTGIDHDQAAAAEARRKAPRADVHEAEFFQWAGRTRKRFDCAAGNPPFIRYQRFSGEVRREALMLCSILGAEFTALTSSWAPFLVATASLLKPGGRMAFVVPAEIGHATYARPLITYLLKTFAKVQIIAIRKKLFRDLSEDAWLLFADGFGDETRHLLLSTQETFEPSPRPPASSVRVSREEWNVWNNRLRPFLLPTAVRSLYQAAASRPSTKRLGEVAKVGIGYVTGANEFFHLRPSEAREAGIPSRYLHASVRNGRALSGKAVTPETVRTWAKRDDPMLLLRLDPREALTLAIKRYLNSPEAHHVMRTYKCRNRDPWYAVPDVTIPDAFLPYMSGKTPLLVANLANCVCTNSVHAVSLNGAISVGTLQRAWKHPLTVLSCEIEGHPLGGGMLKLEPREASRVLLTPRFRPTRKETDLIQYGLEMMQRWRHHGGQKATLDL